MTVADLIRELERYPEDAEVLFMGQPNYPFEYSIEGLCQRHDFERPETDEDGETHTPEGNQSDVFLCEGEQVRYGNGDAWDHCS